MSRQKAAAAPSAPDHAPEAQRSLRWRAETADHDQLVAEIAAYIQFYNGPDPEGRAHPSRRINIHQLTDALTALVERGLCKEVRCHHFRRIIGIWDEPTHLDEVLKRRVEALLADEYGGDLPRMLSAASSMELCSAFVDSCGARKIPMSMNLVGDAFGRSPYKMFRRYLELTGRVDLLVEFKPYHLSHTTHGTYSDPALVDEVLKKKLDQLLAEKFDGDLVRMLTEADSDDLLSPLKDSLGGREVLVSTAATGREFGCSPFAMFRRYLELTGRTELLAEFKTYHVSQVANGTYLDPQILDEILRKKVDQLLATRFDGDLVRMLTETQSRDLTSPLKDTLGGRDILVSMHRLGNLFGRSPLAIFQHYLNLTGENGILTDLRPYHLSHAPDETYADSAVVDALLVRKIDQLLVTKFDGDLVRLLTRTSSDDLKSPLVDSLGGRQCLVSMEVVCGKFAASPIAMLRRYLELAGRTELLAELRPYHLLQAPNGTYAASRNRDEVLQKKVDQLLRTKFSGDILRMFSEATVDDLMSPFKDSLGGLEISVGVFTVVNWFRASPYLIFKRYAFLHGIDFPYGPGCFNGPPETRRRRIEGMLSATDLRSVRTDAGTYHTAHFGFRNYDSPEKTIARELIVDIALSMFADQPISYLGLESEQLASIREVNAHLNLDAARSTVVERDPRVLNAILAVRDRLPASERQVLRQVEVRKGSIEEELSRLSHRYNLVNLDYLGQFSKEKAGTIAALFASRRLADRSLLLVTLADRGLDRNRAVRSGYSSEQMTSLEKVVREAAGAEWTILAAGSVNYEGGTNGSRASRMLVSAFQIMRRSDLP